MLKLVSLASFQPALTRWLHTCSVLRLPVVVAVPSMGDSISEGSIAAILKGSGAEVAENEVIAQVETDKVTIDIRSPIDGKIESLLIKEDDIVVPGQTVAVVGETSSSGAKLMTSTPVPPAPAPAPAAAAEPSPARLKRYTPMIRFPPRMTPAGQRISSLPAEQALRFFQQTEVKAADPGLQVPKAPTQVVYSQRALTRRELTEEEMETIMLGGAMP